MLDRKTRFYSVMIASFVASGISLVACGGSDDGPIAGTTGGGNGSANESDYDGGGLSIRGDGDGDGGVPSGMGGAPPLPEEIEEVFDYRAPVATGKYLWSANPESGRVALIDVEQLTVEVLTAGLRPTFLAPVTNANAEAETLVLNVGSADATRFTVLDGENGREIIKQKVETHAGANRLTISESGKFAVAWSGPETGQVVDPTQGFQEITVIRLGDEEAKATRLTVGFRPDQIVLAEDDESLVVVSEEGMTVVDLTTQIPEPLRWIELGLDEEVRDVSINAEATHALVRRGGESIVELFDLALTDAVTNVDFGAAVTDVDLSRSGRGVAVVRSESTLHTFELASLVADAADFESLKIEGELFGSAELGEGGTQAVVYTNAATNERISVVDLRPGESFLSHRTLSTTLPVYSVNLTPDGEHGVVMSADESGARSDTFSVVALTESRFPRIVGTAAPVAQVALGNSFGVVTSASTALSTYEAHLISLPSLSVKTLELAGNPLSAGVLATDDLGLAFVAQAHAEGRVTFFDFEADQARTLTGFELSAEVVDE